MLLIASPQSIAAKISADDADDLRFFENHVRPLLVNSCLECHSGSDPKGGLALDRIERIHEGGDSGAAIDLESHESSLLLEAIRYESFEMPPDNPLSAEQIDVLTEWIERGAPWPGDELLEVARSGAEFTEADRNHWSFQPVRREVPPEVPEPAGALNEIDRFVIARLVENGLELNDPAERHVLLRRLSFDLIGLPPTPEMTAEFLADQSPQAYERMVDRLLESPRYGERWAQSWLDLVRYADSDGYKADFARPHAWRYRDYVVKSLNDDKPYDRFILEQLAGDEVAPDDPDAWIATGFLRHGIYEFNQRDAPAQWQIILDDVTETTADAFLGLGFSCARCHDHKYDPIRQEDYFRLQAFFSSLQPIDEQVIADENARVAFEEQQREWLEATASIRAELEKLEQPFLDRAKHDAVIKFPPEIQKLYETPADELTTNERQIVHLVHLQVVYDQSKVDAGKKLKDDALQRWKELRNELKEFDELRPASLPAAYAASDVCDVPAVTYIPGRENMGPIEPGFPTLFDPNPARIELPDHGRTTGRRTALARWIADPNNPLTARVLVNRVWQQYFGRGLVETSSDFGLLGDKPSHPKLLDYLAARFVDEGWSLKKLHRWIVTSAVYRQSSFVGETHPGHKIDADNRLLWRMNRRRLDSGQLRDAWLAVSGEIDHRLGGSSVSGNSPRRTVYVKIMRNKRDHLLDSFDLPDRIKSVGQRGETTTPNQALMLFNSPWAVARASAFAKRVQSAGDSDDRAAVAAAIELAFNRPASPQEIDSVLNFMLEQREIADQDQRQSSEPELSPLGDFCHVLLNSNEFIYLD